MDWWPLLCRFTVLRLASISVMRCFASARSARTCTWRTSAFQTWVSKISWWQPGRNPGYIQVSPCLFCNFLDCLETEDVIWHRARTCPQHAATIFSCLQYTRPLFYSSLPWIGAVQKVTLPLDKTGYFWAKHVQPQRNAFSTVGTCIHQCSWFQEFAEMRSFPIPFWSCRVWLSRSKPVALERSFSFWSVCKWHGQEWRKSAQSWETVQRLEKECEEQRKSGKPYPKRGF